MRARSLISAVASLGLLTAFAPGFVAAPAQAVNSYVTATPDRVDFGTVNVGSSTLLTTTITNTSSQSLQIGAIVVLSAPFSSANNLDAESPRPDACAYDSASTGLQVPQTLAPGDSCLEYIKFSPTEATTFTDSGTLPIYDALGSTLTTDQVEVIGVAEAPATSGGLTDEPTFLDFGTLMVGESATQAITVTNTSNGKVQFRGSIGSPANVYFHDEGTGAADECYNANHTQAKVLSVGASCVIRVRFAPTGKGARQGNLAISQYPATGPSGQVVPYSSSQILVGGGKGVPLSGAGAVASLSLASTKLAFGKVTVGGTKVLSTVVKNTSPRAVQIVSRYQNSEVGPAPSSSYVAGDCERRFSDVGGEDRFAVLAPGATCVLRVAFRPAATGARSGNVYVDARVVQGVGDLQPESNIVMTNETFKGTATGVAPTVEFSPSTLKFPTIAATQEAAKQLTVTNTSDRPMRFGLYANGTTFAGRVVPSGSQLPPTSCIKDEYGALRLVQPGESCSFTVIFRPPHAATYKMSLDFVAWPPITSDLYYAGFPNGSELIRTTVKATGRATAPTFEVAPKAVDFGKVLVGRTQIVDVTVTNTSPVGLGYLARFPDGSTPFSVAPANGDTDLCFAPDQATPGYLGKVVYVAPGETCVLRLVFTPTAAETTSQTITIDAVPGPNDGTRHFMSTYYNPIATKTLRLRGSGAGITYQASPTSFDFGNVTWNSSKLVKVKLTNTSPIPLGFAPGFPLGTAFGRWIYQPGTPEEAEQCVDSGEVPAMIEPGASCYVTGRFAPMSAGVAQTTVTIGMVVPTGHPGNPYEVVGSFTMPAKGTGVVPKYSLSPTSMSFGQVAVGSAKMIRVRFTNDSDVTLHVDNGFGTGTDFSRVLYSAGSPEAADQCVSAAEVSRDIPPGGSCYVTGRFAPQSDGKVTAGMNVNVFVLPGVPGNADVKVATTVVPATGTGVQPKVTLSKTALAFNEVPVGFSATRTFTVTNDSAGRLAFIPRTVGGSPYDLGEQNDFSDSCYDPNGMGFEIPLATSVRPGESCKITVRFWPSSDGSFPSTLSVDVVLGDETYDDMSQWGEPLDTRSVKVTGTAAWPDWKVSSTSVDFGEVTTTGKKTMTVTITNNSTVGLAFEPQFDATGGSSPFHVFDQPAENSDDCVDINGSTTRLMNVPAGQTCSMRVELDASATYRPSTMSVTAYRTNHNTRTLLSPPGLTQLMQNTRTVTLKGSVVAATATLSPSTAVFRTVPVGSTKVVTIKVTNTSTVPMKYSLTGPAGTAYRVYDPSAPAAGDCVDTTPGGFSMLNVAPGDNCNMRVEFAPTAAGSQPVTLTVVGSRGSDTEGRVYLTGFGTFLLYELLDATGTGR